MKHYQLHIGLLLMWHAALMPLPAVNLGASNILDGGPIRPNPGWYWIQYNSNYHSTSIRDGLGNVAGGIASPNYDLWATVGQLIYQSYSKPILNAHLGIDVTIPLAFYSHIDCNLLGLRSSGSGFGDIHAGVYAQWDPIKRRDGRPLFVHRLEF